MKRNIKNGQYVQDRDFVRGWLMLLGLGLVLGPTFIGINNIWSWFKSFETVFVVEETLAEEVVKLSWQDEVKKMIKDAGLDVELASRIIQHESWWDPDNTHVNKDGTKDRGLWMFHEIYHAEVSDDCAYDYRCSTVQAIRVIKQRGWDEWVAYRHVK